MNDVSDERIVEIEEIIAILLKNNFLIKENGGDRSDVTLSQEYYVHGCLLTSKEIKTESIIENGYIRISVEPQSIRVVLGFTIFNETNVWHTRDVLCRKAVEMYPHLFSIKNTIDDNCRKFNL